MNRTFKTVWNARRHSLVAVNEAKASCGKADRTGSMVGGSHRASVMKSAVLTALFAAMTSAMPALAADAVYDFDFNATGSVTHDNVTVTEGSTLTFDSQVVEDGVTFPGGTYTVKGTLTNEGTITGQGTWSVAGTVTNTGEITMASIVTDAADVAFDNQSGSTANIGSLTNSGAGVIQNAGSLTVTTLTPGAGSVTNSNTLVVTTLAMGSGHAASSAVLTNTGNATVGSVTGSGQIVNDGEGTLAITSDWTLQNNQLVNNGEKVTLAQTTVGTGSSITGDAEGTTEMSKLTVSDGGFVDTEGSLTVTTGGVDVAAGSRADAAGTFTVAGGIDNAGSMTVGTLVSTGTVTNSDTMDVTTMTSTGSISNAGTFGADTLTFSGTGNTFTNTAGTATLGTVTGDVAFDNKAGASIIFTENYTVADGKTFTNAGSLTAQGLTVAGTLDNSAASGVSLESLTVTGEVKGAGALSVTNDLISSGSFAQSAVTAGSVENSGTMNVSGTLTAETADFNTGSTGTVGTLDATTINHDGSMIFTTVKDFTSLTNEDGTLTATTVTGRDNGGTVSNNAGATLAVSGTLTAESLSNAGTANLGVVDADVITNSGALTASGTVAADSVTNSGTGTMSVTGNLTVTGELANTSSGTVTLAGAQNTAGTLDNDKGKIDVTTGDLSADTVENAAGAEIVVAGELTSTSGVTNAGAITLNGTGTHAVATIENAEGGSFTAVGTVDTNSLVNSGTVSVADLTADAITNSKGSITASGTLTTSGTITNDAQFKVEGTGTHTVGTLDNNASATFESAGALSAGVVTNDGSLTAADLTVTTSIANNGALTSSGTADLNNFSQTASGTAGFGSVTFKGQSGESGFNGSVTSTGDITFAADSNYTGNSTVNAGGALNVAGTLTAGSLVSTGAATINGTASAGSVDLGATTIGASGALTTGGTSTMDSLTMGTGSSLTFGTAEGDTLTITTAGDLDGVTYNQTNGTIAFSDGKWFTNSTINVSGGSLDLTGMGNALGEGNTFSITGTSAPELDQGLHGNESWRDGFVIVTAGSMDASNTVTLNAGGLLDVGTIDIAAAADKAIIFNGGALQTGLSQFFEGVQTDALEMQAANESGRVTIDGSIIGVNSVGDWTGNVDKMNFDNGGDIIFDDAAVSVEAVSTIVGLFGEKASGVDIHFTGTTDKVFTVDVANSLFGDGSYVDNGVIFDTATLYSRTDADETGKTLVVGGTAGEGEVALTGSMGFAKVALTESVRVEGGKELALVGAGDENYGSMVGDNGSVTVTGSGSKLTLGSLARTQMTGSLNTVTLTDNGTVLGKAGHYKLAAVDAQNGTFSTGTAGTVDVTTFSFGDAGVLDNKGTLAVETFSDVVGASGTNAGTLTVTTASDIAGAYVNDGSMTVVNDGTLSGSITNNRTLAYNGTLTVAGKLTNAADATVTVGALSQTADQSVVNAGTFTSSGANNLTGGSTDNPNTSGKYAFENKAGATANLDKGETVIGSNDVNNHVVFKNQGTAKFSTVTVTKGGTLRNYKTTDVADAQVTADTITVDFGGILSNTGTITVNDLVMNGTQRNLGTINVRNVDIGGSTLSLRPMAMMSLMSLDGVEPLSADRVHEAFTAADSNDGDYNVSNTANVNILYANNKTFQGTATVNINENAGFQNKGTLAVNNVVFKTENGRLLQDADTASTELAGLDMTAGGLVEVLGGTFKVDEVNFAAGEMSFDGESGTPEATIALKDNVIGGRLSIDNAKVTIGDAAGWTAPADVSANAVLANFAGQLNLTTGSLAVGDGAFGMVEDLNAGDAWFGSDSLFVVDTAKLSPAESGATAALVGSGSVTIVSGAKLHFSSVGLGTYYVTKDFAEEALGDDSWQNFTYESDNKELVLTQDDNGNILLTVTQKPGTEPGGEEGQEPGGEEGQQPGGEEGGEQPGGEEGGEQPGGEQGGEQPGGDAGQQPDEPHKTVVAGVAIPNILSGVIDDPDMRDVNAGGAIGFINRVVEPTYLAEDQMVEVINAAANIGAAGGLYAQNMTLVQNGMDMVERHLSYEDVHFNNGREALWQGARLWVNALGQNTNASGYDFTGGSADFDGTNYGVMLGADFATDNGLRWGAAFAAQKGSVDSSGSVVSTENEADAYSLFGYAAKQFGAFNVIGHIGYTHIDSDITQKLPGSMQLGSHTLEAGNDMLTFGLRGEWHLPVTDNAAIVPYAGIRAITIFSMDETSKIDGKDAFKYDNDSATQVQIPFGVALQMNRMSESGWMTRGVFDVGLTAVAGDKGVDTTVSAFGVSATDQVSAEFADDLFGSVRLGLSAEKGNWTVGGNLGLTTGEHRDGDVTFGLNARMKF